MYTLMMKRILSILFTATLLMGMPQVAKANTAIEIVDNDFQTVTITLNPSSSVLHVTGAANQTLYIYNVTGLCVMTLKIDSNDRRFELNLPKGCYIVKVGKVARKISVK